MLFLVGLPDDWLALSADPLDREYASARPKSAVIVNLLGVVAAAVHAGGADRHFAVKRMRVYLLQYDIETIPKFRCRRVAVKHAIPRLTSSLR